MAKLLIILILFFLMLGCNTNLKYRETNRCWDVVNKHYSYKDTLFVKDYIVCYTAKEEDDDIFTFNRSRRMTPINADSVFDVFRNALNKTGLPIKYDSISRNRCSYDIKKKYPKIWRRRSKEILELFSIENRVVLVPYINIYETWGVVLKGSPATEGDFFRNSFLSIGLFIVQNDKVVYKKTVRHVVSLNYESREDPIIRQTQVHWNKLVELGMKDYRERRR